MAIVRSMICRIAQLGGCAMVVAGCVNIVPLYDAFNGGMGGQVLELATLSKFVLPVTAPIFGGLLLIFGIQQFLTYAADLDQRMAEYPDQPWMWRQEWADRHIKLNVRWILVGVIVAWVLYLTVGVPIALLLASLKNPTLIYTFLGAFGLILFAFTRMLWVNQTWSRAELMLASVPGVIGGPISGVVILKNVFDEGTEFRVILKCERQRISSGKHQQSYTDIVWQSQKILDHTMNSGLPNTTAIPVYFAVPCDAQPSGKETIGWAEPSNRRQSKNHIRWYVDVGLREDPLVGAKFEVPVFQTQDSSPAYIEDPSLVAAYVEKPEPLVVLNKIGFREIPSFDGKRLQFSPFNPQVFVALLVTSMLIGIGLMANFMWVRPWPVPLFIALIPGLIGVLTVYGMLEMLFWKSSVTILPDQIDVEAGYTGFRRKFHYARDQPPSLIVAKEFERQSGPPTFSIRFESPGGKQYNLIRQIDGEQDANAVRNGLITQCSKKVIRTT